VTAFSLLKTQEDVALAGQHPASRVIACFTHPADSKGEADPKSIRSRGAARERHLEPNRFDARTNDRFSTTLIVVRYWRQWPFRGMKTRSHAQDGTTGVGPVQPSSIPIGPYGEASLCRVAAILARKLSRVYSAFAARK
jgi:hypothetical protein